MRGREEGEKGGREAERLARERQRERVRGEKGCPIEECHVRGISCVTYRQVRGRGVG